MRRAEEGIAVERTSDVSLIRGMNGGCLDLKEIRFLVDHRMKIDIVPKMKGQTLSGAVSYWEGAAGVNLGKDFGGEGKGYLEVTGLIQKRPLHLCANHYSR